MIMERDWDSVMETYRDEVPAIIRRRQKKKILPDTTTANDYKCSAPAELSDNNFNCWATVVKETNGNDFAEKKNAA